MTTSLGLLSIPWLMATPPVEVPQREEVIVRPEAAPGPLDNPLKGWCSYTNAGRIHQPYSMVFFYASWKELEPEPGRYDFEGWEERLWSVPEAGGKHIVFRVFADYPRRPSGLPEWLRDLGVKETPYDDHGGGLSPDYDDPRVVEALERLIEALGQRYNDHPRIAFIQLGLLGFWGEWHTYPRNELFASEATQRRVIEAYRKAFPDKLLQARYPDGPAAEPAWIGYHDDMFPQDTDNGHAWSFLAKMRSNGQQENWQRAAIGGEMVPHEARRYLGPEFDLTLRMAEDAHFSWVGPYNPALQRNPSDEFRARSEALVRKLGYQFRWDEIRHVQTVSKGDVLEVTIQGENEGVAPLYYPWPVELALLDESGEPVERQRLDIDVRDWPPGPIEFVGKFEVEAPQGRYELAIGILDPWNGRPAVGFANELPRREGWTVLSAVIVIEP
ncbi:hypothetical protein BH23PLA1_BH23PLA1_29940 [soil metagenome]